jgi:hypothetical protein
MLITFDFCFTGETFIEFAMVLELPIELPIELTFATKLCCFC